MNIAQFLARAARVFPDRVAIAQGPHAVFDYRTLAQHAARMAHHLRHTMRLNAADRIGLCMPNSPAWLEALCGIWWAGLTAVPVDPSLADADIAWRLRHTGASLCFVDAGTASAGAGAVGEARTVDTASDRYQKMISADREASIHWNVPEDVAWIQFTRGTRGTPKAAMISHRGLLAMSLGYFADVDPVGPHDCIIHAAPLAHAPGLYALPHLAASASHILPESRAFDADELFRLAEHWPGAGMFATPAMVSAMVGHASTQTPAPDGLKTIVYGGDPMEPGGIARALSVMGPRFVQVYGQAESPMAIAALSRFHLSDTAHPRHAARIASVGVAQSPAEVRVLGEDEQPAPPGEAGEVVVRGDTVMRGYWRDAQATAAALRGGWLHTGDRGSLDADGFLTLRNSA